MANQPQQQELKIELSPEVAAGQYSNLAMIAHSGQEFFVDFINRGPHMPQARVQSRIIMTPENAKNLLFALRDNIAKYEETFGPIQQTRPRGAQAGGSDIPNPFQA